MHAAQLSVRPLMAGRWFKWPPLGDAWDVRVVGNYAYVATGAGGLAVIDVSNPTNCVQVGSRDTQDFAYGVAVSGNYAYVADRSAGLQIINISNPANCGRAGGYDTSGLALGVAVAG